VAPCLIDRTISQAAKFEGEKKGEERKTCFVSKKKSPHELIMQEVLLIFNLWMVIAY
jgi:hypothetical protein